MLDDAGRDGRERGSKQIHCREKVTIPIYQPGVAYPTLSPLAGSSCAVYSSKSMPVLPSDRIRRDTSETVFGIYEHFHLQRHQSD